jgi:RNase P protein component
LIREAVRLRLPLIKPGWDLVWIARAGIAGKKVDAVIMAVDDLLRRARLYATEGVETEAAQSRIMEGGKNPPVDMTLLADNGAPRSNPQAQKQPQTE